MQNRRYKDMANERKKYVTMRYTKEEIATLDSEAKTLGMTRSEYIRVLMQMGKGRLYIDYLHSLVGQINTKLARIEDVDFARLAAKVNWLTLAVKEIQSLSRNGAEYAQAPYLQKVDTDVQKLKDAISKGY
jgi:hypothetical protein